MPKSKFERKDTDVNAASNVDTENGANTASKGANSVGNNPVDKFTAFLRTQYLRNIKNTTIYLGAALVVAIGLSVLFDYLVPFSSWGNIVRALVVLVDSVIFFSAGYLASFFFYMSNRVQNPDYVSIKERFSPSWRNRIAIVVGAILFTMALTASKGLAYTIVSSIIVAGVAGIVIFVSRTEEEREREFYGVPDKRDDAYRAALANAKEKREARQKKKKDKDK